jgi:hypothetical protein
MKKVMVVMVMLATIFASYAQSGNLLTKADSRAKNYCGKMKEKLELSEKQQREIYKLRFELSLAINLALMECKEQPEKLDKKIALAQETFQAGIKKTLSGEQFQIWDVDRKETYAAMTQQNQFEHVAETELP